MGELIRLVRIDFDEMENDPRSARTETQIGIFTGYKAVSDWFRAQETLRPYTGYDWRVYPMWRLERVDVIA